MNFLILSLFSLLVFTNSVDSLNLIINGSFKRGLILFLTKENWKVNLKKIGINPDEATQINSLYLLPNSIYSLTPQVLFKCTP